MDPAIAARIPRPRAPGPPANFIPPLPSTNRQQPSEVATLLDTSDEDEDEDDDEEEDEDIDIEDIEDDAEGEAEAEPDVDQSRITQDETAPTFAPAAYNLHSILPLSTLTTSSHKPHCGPLALLSPSTSLFWQSDGPQPHLLNIHFFKLVEIRVIRVYLDFDLDESYTPTRMQFWAGTGQHDLEMVGEEKWTEPRGWQRVNLSGVGGGKGGHFRDWKRVPRGWEEEWSDLTDDDEDEVDEDDEKGEPRRGRRRKRENILKGQGVLRCFLLQIRVLENHQNGKDTHIRGLQIFAKDKAAGRKRAISPQAARTPKDADVDVERNGRSEAKILGGMGSAMHAQLRKENREHVGELIEPEWARDVELR